MNLINDISKPLMKECYKLGIKGFLNDMTINEELPKALNKVKNGGYYYPITIEEIQNSNEKYSFRKLLMRHPKKLLTKREYKIFNYFGEGLNSKVILEKLHISERTIEWHLRNIRKKLQLKNTNEIIYASVKFKFYE